MASAQQVPHTFRTYHPHETQRVESLAGLPLASFGRRLAAYLIDFVLVALTYLPVALLAHFLRGDFKHEEHVHIEVSFHDPFSLVWIVVYFALSVYIGNGKTIGKKIAGIRIVSLTHPRLSLWQSIERALGYGASALEAGFGFLQFFIHPNRCCVHDRIAETIVVRDR